jgi:hypothetical protein
MFTLILPEKAMKLQTELPVTLQFGSNLIEPLQILLVLCRKSIFPFYDQVLVFPDESRLLFPCPLRLGLAAGLGLFRGTTATAFSAGLPGPSQPVFDETHRLQNGLIGLHKYMKYTQLMFDILPLFRQSLFIQGRTIGHNHLRFDARFGKLGQHDGKSHGIGFIRKMKRESQIIQWIGGDKDRLTAIVHFVDTANPGEVLPSPVPIGLLIHLIRGPLQAAMNESNRYVQTEILFHASFCLFGRQPVTNQGSDNGVSDGIGVPAALWHKIWYGPKRSTAFTVHLIDSQGQFDDRNSAISNISDVADDLLPSFALFATLGTRVCFGAVRFFLDNYGFLADDGSIHACYPPDLRLFCYYFPSNRRIRAFSLMPETYSHVISIE